MLISYDLLNGTLGLVMHVIQNPNQKFLVYNVTIEKSCTTILLDYYIIQSFWHRKYCRATNNKKTKTNREKKNRRVAFSRDTTFGGVTL